MSKPSTLEILLIGLSTALVTTTGEAANQQIYHDYARVLKVSPIMETIQVPVRREDCQTPARTRRELPTRSPPIGDLRPNHSGLTLADAIRQDWTYQLLLATPRTKRECRWIEVFETREHIVAYRVRFRYGKDTFVRRLDHDPGDRLRIRVEVRPLD